jgi:hypothetical protein
MSRSNFSYIGLELKLFAQAGNWKSYLAMKIEPYLYEAVLEVGAGIGSNIAIFCGEQQKSWLALEADADLAARMRSRKVNGALPGVCDVRVGTLARALPTCPQP